MANTGIIFGNDIVLYHNTGTEQSPVWTPFAHATTHTYSASTNMRERVTKDTGGTTGVKPGIHGVPTIGISGLATYDGIDYHRLEEMRKNRERIHIKRSGRPTGDTGAVDATEVEGDKYEEGYGYVGDVNMEAPVEGDSTYSATISVDGQLTPKTVPAA